MRRILMGLLLFAVVLVQPACSPEPDPTPTSTSSAASSAPADKEKSPVIVCITTKKADITPARVKANKKQDLAWKSHDSAYMLRFVEHQWDFAEDPDQEETVGGVKFLMIQVPAAGMSRTFTLKYSLPAGDTKEHHYRIDYDPMSGPPDLPNGPVIIGEG